MADEEATVTQTVNTVTVTPPAGSTLSVTSTSGGALSLTDTTGSLIAVTVTPTVATLQVESDFAPKVSPVFTGTPIAPTASAGTNNTQIATTAYVDSAISLENTLDEMDDTTISSISDNELLQYDSSSSKWINQTFSEAGVAPVASPAFTGNPTAPTQSSGNNSTRLATTAYVDNAVSLENTLDEMDDTTISSISDNELLQYDSSSSKWINQTFAEAGVAPVASPTFTGTPLAPTASAATNSTQLATTAYVTTAVSNLIDAAPAALDTLNELAAALNDDASFSTTVTNSIATKLPLAGGTLTGALTVGADDTGHDVKFFGATSGKYLLWDESDDSLIFPDNVKAKFGAGLDLHIYHDGTDSRISNYVGDLVFRNYADDKDIIFVSDDGSGNTTEYIRLDGGVAYTVASKAIRFDDSVSAYFGTGADFDINHDGTNTNLLNWTGDLIIKNTANDKDVIFQCDDGSGGLETYFYLDGSMNTDGTPKTVFPDNSKLQFGSGSSDLRIYHDATDSHIESKTGTLYISNNVDNADIRLQASTDSNSTAVDYVILDSSQSSIRMKRQTKWDDNIKATFGDGEDLQIYHDGSNSYIKQAVGDLYIQQQGDDKDIVFQCDDGSGGVTAYLTLDGSAGYTTSQKEIRIADSQPFRVGTGGDSRYMHDGSNTYLDNYTGNFYVRQNTDDGDLIFQCDDGSGGVETYFYLDGSSGYTKFSEDIKLLDSVNLRLGVGNDLYLYHDGSNSHIKSTTSDLYIQNDADDKDIIFQCDDGSGGMETYFFLDGSRSSGSPYTIFPDNSYLTFGDNTDLIIHHNATHSYIDNYTGTLYIRNHTNDSRIRFQCDDGAGGTATYFDMNGGQATHDGSATTMLMTSWYDNSRITLGGGFDMQIWHDGTNSIIYNAGGDFYIKQATTDKDLIFQCDDGSGGLETYYYLDGSEGLNKFSKDVYIGINGGGKDFVAYGATSSKYVHWDASNDALILPDSTNLRLGTGSDLHIYHDGTDSYISNNTGSLIIQNTLDNGDVVFKSDDGSGGVETYFFLDGSSSGGDPFTRFPDNSYLVFGDSGDLNIRHDGTNTSINNETGDLYIRNNADDKDIIFQSDDGSGGSETYFYCDGSLSAGYPYTVFPDNSYLALGNSGDLLIYHTGTNSELLNWTGDLYIKQTSNDGNIVIQNDDGSGGLTDYIIVDGSNHRTVAYKDFRFNDSVAAKFGTGSDLSVYHNGSHSYISNNTGNLYITNYADDQDILFGTDDGSGSTETYFFLDGSASSGNPFTVFPDNSHLAIGTGTDLQIYHNGTNSTIDNYTGHLFILNRENDKDIIFQCDDGSGGLETYFYLDGSLSSGNPYTIFPDNSFLSIGTGADLQIYHNGSHSLIENVTGSLYIRNNADDQDIIFQCDDGSGGLGTYFYLDGGFASYPNTIFPDNSILRFGTGGDLAVYHTGVNSIIHNAVGNLDITNGTDDGLIRFYCDNGSGGTTAYFTIDGNAGLTNFAKGTLHNDNVRADFGNGHDLRVYHDGTDSYLQNNTGDYYIQNIAADKDIIFQADDGSGSFETYFACEGDFSSGHPYTVFPDNSRLSLGNGADTSMYHTGSVTYFENNTGDWYFLQVADDKDIIFQSDDGSGGTETYFYLDGSLSSGSPYTVFPDASYLALGTGADLRIYHDGTNSWLNNATGDLKIRNAANDKDIIFQCDDGNGGETTYFYLDGSAAEYSSGTTDALLTRFPDASKIALGTGADMKLFHNGTNSYIQNETGDLYITQNADDKDIIFQSDDGSGGVATYFKLDGSYTVGIDGETYTPSTVFPDHALLALGTHRDLKLWYNNVRGRIAYTGGNEFQISALNNFSIGFNDDDAVYGESAIVCYKNGAVQLRYDNSAKFQTASTGVTITGGITTTGASTLSGGLTVGVDDTGYDVKFFGATSGRYVEWDASDDALEFADNTKAKFGDGNDLEIYHDGSHSYIEDTGQGDLYIKGSDDVYIMAGPDIAINCNEDSSVSLWYNNSKKFETTNTGATVTGNLTVSADLIINGTTTTVNSTTVTIDDPVFTLGGDTAPSSDDNKDRGIEFRYHNGSAAKIGFFGWDDSSEVFTFIADASPLSEVYSGSAGNVAFGNVIHGTGSASAPSITFAGDLDTGIYHYGTNSFAFTTSGALRGQFQSGGKLKLWGGLELEGNTALIKTTLTVGVDDTGHDVKFFGATSGSYMLWDESTDDLVLAGAAQLGIGTTAPEALLHVKAADSVTGVLKIEGGKDTVTSVGEINSEIQFGSNDPSVGGTGNVGGKISSVTEYNNGAWVGLAFYTYHQTQSDLAERVRIAKDGKVGIGVTSPSSQLHVETADNEVARFKSTDEDAQIALQDNTDTCYISHDASADIMQLGFNSTIGSTDNLSIDTSGRVGIGNIAPSYTLSVAKDMGSSGTLAEFKNTDSTYSQQVWLNFDSNKDVTWHQGSSNGGVTFDVGGRGHGFQINGTEVMRINDSTVQVGVDDTGYDVKFFGATSGSYMLWDESTDDLILGGDARLGIGTTTPAQKFVVQFVDTDTSFSGGGGGDWGSEGIRIENTSATTNTMAMLHLRNSDADIHIAGIRQGTDDSDLGFFFEGSEKARLTNAGYLGIGTTAPAQPLDIHTASNDTGIRVYTTPNTRTAFELLVDSATNGNADWKLYHGTVVNTRITSNAGNATYFNAGNVGIGTTSPVGKLTIVDTTSSSTVQKFHVGRATNAGLYITDTDNSSYIKAIQDEDEAGYGNLILAADSAGNKDGYISFESEGEKMRITADGKVGIGTSNPSTHLEVRGQWIKLRSSTVDAELILSASDSTTNNSIIKFGDNDNSNIGQIKYAHNGDSMRFITNESEAMRIDSAGKVGIGTTSPACNLQIDTPAANNAGQGIRINRPSAGTNYHSVEFSTDGTVDWSVGQNSNDAFEVYENGASATTRFTIKEGGNVGIGTTSPSSLLNLSDASNNLSHQIGFSYVSGGTETDAFTIGRNSSTGNLEFHSDMNNHGFEFKHNAAGTQEFNVLNMNVGIGTDAPAQKLDVSGIAKIGDSTSNGHLIGRKDYSVTQSFSTGLTVTLADDTACHVKVFISGDWSGHSSIAYVGEFFIQNAANSGSYKEPGIILTEHDNLASDGILSKIVDGTGDSFEIQFRANTSSSTSVSGRLCYHIMGDATAVS